MKNLLFSTFAFSLCLLFSFTGDAQKIFEDDITMSLGTQNAFFIEIEGADDNTAEKIWKDYIKGYGKTKKNKKAKEWYSQQVPVPTINGASPIDLYVKFEEMKDMTRTYFWIDLGGEFANSIDNEKQSDGIEEFMKGYYDETRKYIVGKEVKEEEDNLKDLEKDFGKLEKKNEDYHKQIEKAKKKIAEMESNIEKNIVEQEKKQMEIEDQKTAVSKVTEKLNQIGNRYN